MSEGQASGACLASVSAASAKRSGTIAAMRRPRLVMYVIRSRVAAALMASDMLARTWATLISADMTVVYGHDLSCTLAYMTPAQSYRATCVNGCQHPPFIKSTGVCRPCYRRARYEAHERKPPTRRRPGTSIDQILMEMVDRSGGTHACHPFTGTTNRTGYGVLPKVFNGSRLAHRAALALALGRAVHGHTRHSCDNPPCCNPRHLAEGTPADNAQDKSDRGRAKSGKEGQTHCVRGHERTPENIQLKMRESRWIVRDCIPCRKIHNRNLANRRREARRAKKEMSSNGE